MDPNILIRMREDWDQRARENPQYYIATERKDWDDRAFYRSGEINVANEVMPDMRRICGGAASPLDLRALEIGCGVGRMTRMLARIFKHVSAVDVSREMIERARINLADCKNADPILGDGATLSALADESHDFAFSFVVFQHIPSAEVIGTYCREVFRVLRPGSLFKFQVNGTAWERSGEPDTWEGVSFTEEEAQQLSRASGFHLEASLGAGTQFFWLWFRKPWRNV
jgi:SAM-dependent methyltransferase